MLPFNPIIPEAFLRREPGFLSGPIGIGEVFAWQPDIPYSRELCIVSRIVGPEDDRLVFTWDMNYTREVFNDELVFRQSCVRTHFRLFPSTPPQYKLTHAKATPV